MCRISWPYREHLHTFIYDDDICKNRRGCPVDGKECYRRLHAGEGERQRLAEDLWHIVWGRNSSGTQGLVGQVCRRMRLYSDEAPFIQDLAKDLLLEVLEGPEGRGSGKTQSRNWTRTFAGNASVQTFLSDVIESRLLDRRRQDTVPAPKPSSENNDKYGTKAPARVVRYEPLPDDGEAGGATPAPLVYSSGAERKMSLERCVKCLEIILDLIDSGIDKKVSRVGGKKPSEIFMFAIGNISADGGWAADHDALSQFAGVGKGTSKTEFSKIRVLVRELRESGQVCTKRDCTLANGA